MSTIHVTGRLEPHAPEEMRREMIDRLRVAAQDQAEAAGFGRPVTRLKFFRAFGFIMVSASVTFGEDR